MLAGDATIDPRDYEGLGNADFVPTKLVELNGVALETASDDWFVDFDDDGLLEASIGRLPFRTAAQAAAMVAKIIDYDSGAGQWTKEVLLIADEHDGTTNFEQAIHDLSALLPPDYTAQTVSVGSLGDDAAKQSITDAVNSGKLIVNYSGHGGVDMWGQRGQLLNNADVANTWTNVGKLPFVVAMNCLNGLFQGIFGEESLAEAMMRKPNGGAVAAWASSGLTPPATQLVVNQELFRLIFEGTYSTLGEAVAAAKLVVPNQDLRRSWIFFGDPAMQLIDAPQPTAGTTNPPVITTQPQGAPVAAGQQRDAQRRRDGRGAAQLSVVPRPQRVHDEPGRRSDVEQLHDAAREQHDQLLGTRLESVRPRRLQRRGAHDVVLDHDVESVAAGHGGRRVRAHADRDRQHARPISGKRRRFRPG